MAGDLKSAMPDVAERKAVNCKECGEQYVALPEDGICPGCREKASRAAAAPENNRRSALAGVGVPRKYVLTEFEERPWPSDKRKSMSLDQWSGDPWCAYLTGDCGTGKTMFAVELLFRWLCDVRRQALFVKAGKLPGIYFNREHERLVEQLETVPLLVVDELGRGHLGNAWEAVTELLAARYDAMLATVITTNMPLRELSLKDDHVADRIAEGLLLKFTGRSERA